MTDFFKIKSLHKHKHTLNTKARYVIHNVRLEILDENGTEIFNGVLGFLTDCKFIERLN